MENTELGQFVRSLFASWPLLEMLLWAMVIDWGSGVCAAVVEKKLSSKIGYRGAFRKVLILLVVCVSMLFEKAMVHTDIRFPVTGMVAGVFFLNECLSVLENARRAGVPVPPFLKKSLVETIAKISTMADRHIVSKEEATLEIKSAKIDATITHKEEKSGG